MHSVWRFFFLILYAVTFCMLLPAYKIYSCMEKTQDQVFIMLTNWKVSSRNTWELFVRYLVMLPPQFQTLLLLCLILLFVMLNLLVFIL